MTSTTAHWMVLPVIIPILTAMACLLAGPARQGLQRAMGALGVLATLGVAIAMTAYASSGQTLVYALGNWPVPFGIVFTLDRLSAMMVLLTNILGLGAYLYAIQGDDVRGVSFHTLFMMQLTGINGAFLTGDIFNLFVFFEIMLLTAYILVLYGSGQERTRAGLYYVLLNMVGSSIFLISVGVLYALTGTLNMADMAVKLRAVGPQDAALVRGAAMMLLVVFGIKGGLFPLYFWLPRAYASVTAPVAAIFAIMTKVGVYTMLRMTTLMFGPGQGQVASLIEPYLVPLALVTLGLGAAGAMAATTLRGRLAYLLLASVGTIFAGVGVYTQVAIAGSLFYMVHSTLIAGAFFLLADLIREQRGQDQDALVRGRPVREPVLIGLTFMVCVIAAAGLPPMTGFLGKAILLKGSVTSPWQAPLWITVLTGSFFGLVALVRAGTTLLWGVEQAPDTSTPRSGARILPILALLATLIAMTCWAGPVAMYMDQTAAQVLDPAQNIKATLSDGGTP